MDVTLSEFARSEMCSFELQSIRQNPTNMLSGFTERGKPAKNRLLNYNLNLELKLSFKKTSINIFTFRKVILKTTTQSSLLRMIHTLMEAIMKRASLGQHPPTKNFFLNSEILKRIGLPLTIAASRKAATLVLTQTFL